MKKLIFSSLLGFALIAFTGCAPKSSDAEAAAKCDSVKSMRCASDRKAAKCSASGKCAAQSSSGAKCSDG